MNYIAHGNQRKFPTCVREIDRSVRCFDDNGARNPEDGIEAINRTSNSKYGAQ